MVKKFGKDKNNFHKSFRKSQAWRYLSRKENADNFEGRTVLVAQKGLSKKDFADGVGRKSIRRPSGSTVGLTAQEDVDLQLKFVGNQIKSSKYTIFTFLPR